MKKKFNLFALLLVLLVILSPVVKAEDVNEEDIPVVVAEQVTTYVASIGETKYETFDAAYNASVDGDTITLLTDASSTGMVLRKSITIEGANHSLIFETNGIDVYNSTLTINSTNMTFKEYGWYASIAKFNITNSTIIFDGVGKDSQFPWGAIIISDTDISMTNTTFTMDGKNTAASAIYCCKATNINLDNSKLNIKDFTSNAVAWDGGSLSYKFNLTNKSEFTSNHSRSAFAGTFYVVVDNSTLNVINSLGNGSNGSYYDIKNNSKVLFDGNGAWGMSAYQIDLATNSTITATNNAYAGIWVRIINTDETTSITSTNNGVKGFNDATNSGIMFQGNATPSVVNGSLVVSNNPGSGIWTAQTVCNLTLNNAIITNNGSSKATYGGGIYNLGTLVLGENTVIYNNHASIAGDDLYSVGDNVSTTSREEQITTSSVKSDLVLDDCEEVITGWYDDSKDNRWNIHNNESNIYAELVEAGNTKEVLAIKAAHNIYYEITINYVDINGKKIKESTTTKAEINSTYELSSDNISGYKLVETTGVTSGTITDNVEVTYTYAPVANLFIRLDSEVQYENGKTSYPDSEYIYAGTTLVTGKTVYDSTVTNDSSLEVLAELNRLVEESTYDKIIDDEAIIEYLNETYGIKVADNQVIFWYVNKTQSENAKTRSYKDIDGNKISIKVEGCKYHIDGIIKTIKEDNLGEGGEDLPPLVQTGVTVNVGLMSSVVMVISLLALSLLTRKEK